MATKSLRSTEGISKAFGGCGKGVWEGDALKT